MNEVLTYEGKALALMGRDDLISAVAKLQQELDWQAVRYRDQQQRIRDLSPRPLNGVGL